MAGGFGTTVVLLLLGISVNSIFLGVIGEYVGRIYSQVRFRPTTVIERAVNIEPSDRPAIGGRPGCPHLDRARPRVAEFDQYGSTYDREISRAVSLSGQEHDFFLQVKAEVLAELLSRRFGDRDLRVLDVGCGNGGLHRFSAVGRPCDQVDRDRGCRRFCRSRPRCRQNPTVQYDLYDGQGLPYRDGAFDAAFTVCVLHHVPPARWPALSPNSAAWCGRAAWSRSSSTIR